MPMAAAPPPLACTTGPSDDDDGRLVLQQGGCGGSSCSQDWDFWVYPLPPDGPVNPAQGPGLADLSQKAQAPTDEAVSGLALDKPGKVSAASRPGSAWRVVALISQVR